VTPPSPQESRTPLPDENVFGHRKKLDFIRKHISEYVESHHDQKVRILDVGCSNGQYVTIHLGDLGAEILAIDIHEPSIGYAIDHNPYPEIITFRTASIDDLPSDEKFDIVVLADILEHIENPGAFLDSIRERLRDGGIVLVSIPNGYGPFEIESALDRRGCLTWSYIVFLLLSHLRDFVRDHRRGQAAKEPELPYASECGHVQFWTSRRFSALLNKHGFRITRRRNGPWLGALCTSTWWGRSSAFCLWNAEMGDLIPSFMASTWFFALEKKAEKS
jgi:SAM-dependent methyltransferase